MPLRRAQAHDVGGDVGDLLAAEVEIRHSTMRGLKEDAKRRRRRGLHARNRGERGSPVARPAALLRTDDMTCAAPRPSEAFSRRAIPAGLSPSRARDAGQCNEGGQNDGQQNESCHGASMAGPCPEALISIKARAARDMDSKPYSDTRPTITRRAYRVSHQ